MTHTQDGAANAAGTSSLVVDFASKLKDLHAAPARRSKITAPSSTIYIFPPRTTHAPHSADGHAHLAVEADATRAMVRRIFSFTTRGIGTSRIAPKLPD